MNTENTISDNEKQLVTTTFAQVTEIADQAAALFYGRLFEIAPQVKPMFKEADMTEQGRKLMQTLGLAVRSLYRLEAIEEALHQLGKRHIDYGVTEAHYDIVGEALIWTLGQGLGEAFTAEVEAAWVKTYETVADIAKRSYHDE